MTKSTAQHVSKSSAYRQSKKETRSTSKSGRKSVDSLVLRSFTKPAVRRAARKAGVIGMTNDVRESLGDILVRDAKNMLGMAFVRTLYDGRKTINRRDADYGIRKAFGITLCGVAVRAKKKKSKSKKADDADKTE